MPWAMAWPGTKIWHSLPDSAAARAAAGDAAEGGLLHANQELRLAGEVFERHEGVLHGELVIHQHGPFGLEGEHLVEEVAAQVVALAAVVVAEEKNRGT